MLCQMRWGSACCGLALGCFRAHASVYLNYFFHQGTCMTMQLSPEGGPSAHHFTYTTTIIDKGDRMGWVGWGMAAVSCWRAAAEPGLAS